MGLLMWKTYSLLFLHGEMIAHRHHLELVALMIGRIHIALVEPRKKNATPMGVGTKEMVQTAILFLAFNLMILQ